MADKFIEVPSNLEDITILKRFLNELVDKLNSNALVSYPISYPSGYTGPVPYNYSTLVGGYTNTILEAAARADAISGDAKNYITGNLTTNVLQNTEDLATITEQFGTFYNDATAAAWYGLTVKSGELISGFTVSGVDSDTTTPGTAGSVFAISADTFTVGRAIEDIDDPAELAYIAANGLPYGTMYDTVNDEIIPAFLIEWNGVGYDIFFNGKTEFSNYLSPGTTTINGGKITTNTLQADVLKAGTGSTTVWHGGGLVSDNFNGNPYGIIGTPTLGFRLSSNAAGTEADPNIYGAYIKGGYIKAPVIDGATLTGTQLSVNDVKVKAVDYPTNTGAMYINLAYSAYGTARPTYVYSDTILARNYGSGHDKLRMCSNSQFITIIAIPACTTAGNNTITSRIEVSYNNGASYSTLIVQSEVMSNPTITYILNINALSNIIIRASATSNAPVANIGITLLINSQNAV